MALVQDAVAGFGALSGTGGADSEETGTTERPETGGNREEGTLSPGDGATLKNKNLNETGASVPTAQQATPLASTRAESSLCQKVNTTRPPERPRTGEGAASTEPPKDEPRDATTASAGRAATDATTTSAGHAATDATTTRAGHTATDATTTSAGNDATTTSAGNAATTTSAGRTATMTNAGSAATTTSAGHAATDATTTRAGHTATDATTTSAGNAATTTSALRAATMTNAGSAATMTNAGSAATDATTTSAGHAATDATTTSAGHAATMTNAGSDATTTSAGHAATDATTTSAGHAATDATTTSAGHAATTTSAGNAATTTIAGRSATMTNAGSAATDATTTSAGNAATDATTTNQTVVTTKTTTKMSTAEPTKTALDKELEALLSLASADPPPHDVLMIHSEYSGTTDIVKADPRLEEPSVTEGTVPPCPLRPATTWTSANLREFKHRMAHEKHGLLTVRRGEVMTVRVPTHPDGKRLCWEFATDDYDIGFGIYFDWSPVTSTAVTLQVSESSDEEEEEDAESPWHSREGDVERGSVYRLRSRYGEVMQVYRRDSHREVQAGNHEYPGEGVYLLKMDNSYSLLRNKTLYFHVYYSS
ncbi:protein TMED8 [Phyllobates terribilis]|uniref:protein TMED8 n=1 Tax=Phyllobates terribilis TaxID=111132 RepID=UPI003CCADAA6